MEKGVTKFSMDSDIVVFYAGNLPIILYVKSNLGNSTKVKYGNTG